MDISKRPQPSGEIPPLEPPTETKTLDQLAEDAVRLYNDAMHAGAYFLPSGRIIILGAQDMTKVIQDLTRRKGKTLRPVSKPEDFNLNKTTRE